MLFAYPAGQNVGGDCVGKIFRRGTFRPDVRRQGRGVYLEGLIIFEEDDRPVRGLVGGKA